MVKEQEGTEGLILGRCCNFRRSEMLLPRTRPCPVGVFFVEKNVLIDPIQISLFSFIGTLFQAKGITDSIEKFLGSFLLI